MVNNMAILVTGGTGYIGAEVTRPLCMQQDEPLVLFDPYPTTMRLEDVIDRVKNVRGDLGNFSHVLNVVKDAKPERIFHLGGMLSAPSDADPPAAMRSNALGTFHVLEAARLFDVQQVLFSSTIGTYGYDIREDRISYYTIQRPTVF